MTPPNGPDGPDRSRRTKTAVALAAFLLAAFSAAAFGARFPPGEWYATLTKPAWNPPAWVFAPVWTVLYLTIALSGWLVWRRVGLAAARLPLSLYALQLVLNALWSWIFFGLQRPGLALAEIVLLWLAIAATAISFSSFNRLAAALLLPYLAWVGFAAALNLALWRLNA